MIPEQQQQFQLPEEESIDIKKYIFLVLSHWWWFALTIFVSVTIAYLVNRYSQEVYSASCTLIVGEEQATAGSVESVLDELSRIRGKKRKAVVENEISILKSYKMSRLAIEELDFDITYRGFGRRNIAEAQLYHNTPFIVVPDTSIIKQPTTPIDILILSNEKYRLTIGKDYVKTLNFGELFSELGFSFKIVLQRPDEYNHRAQLSNKFQFNFNDINSLANAYSAALAVQVNDEKGSILSLNFSGFVPEQITNYLNKLCEVYIQSNLGEKNITSENTIRFIDRQLRGIVDSLEVTGLRLQNFRSANKVIDLSVEGSYLFKKMQELQEEKADLDIKNRYYSYLLEYIETKNDFSDVVAPSVIGISDQLLNSLVAEINRLNLERRNLTLTVVENTPQTLQIKDRISNIKEALKENINSLINSNSIAFNDLNERFNRIEKEVQKLPSTERQMINIKREFTINDQIYTFLLEKRAEAGITRASNVSNHKILDIARPENVSIIKPKRSMNYMIALALGGIIPLSLLLLIDFFNTKITDRNYLESHLKAPIIGNIGHNEEGTELPVVENQRSSLAESFRALRTNLQYILKEPDSKVIAVSSAVSGEGKTFCSVNLACILAMAGKKTLLVSLDLRRPKVHKVFNLKNKSGMSTFLIAKSNFREIICETNISNLFVATSGPIPPNPAELLGTEKMKEFIEEAQKEFDYIVLDTPPIAIVTDTLTLKNLLDAFVFVVRHNYSEKQVIELANSIYDKHLIKNTGIIINDIQVKGYYGYTYRYGYGYGYGYSYNYSDVYYDESRRENALIIFLRRIRIIRKK